MTFYLIGLGLEKDSITVAALEILKTCDKIYLENYTVNFPYELTELENSLKTSITKLNRDGVESEYTVEEAKSKDIALLVYGDALSATTHMHLIIKCKKLGIPFRIFHNTSILTAVAETGLQIYKFGKTTSMPNWKEHINKPTSFMKIIKENLQINAHTLILTDIDLNFKDSISQLIESSKLEKIVLEKTIAISNAGTKNQLILFDTLENLKEKDIKMPFCLIIPSKLHFIEEEAIESLKEK
ncbi:MAG: diphthine synthase [Nanoarchaeota archaeon]|nr:diphthine synthase [Nanoarchaeota archaeon]